VSVQTWIFKQKGLILSIFHPLKDSRIKWVYLIFFLTLDSQIKWI